MNTELTRILNEERPTLEALLKLNCSPGTDVATIVLQELEYLQMAAINNPAILECDPNTIVYAVKSVLKKNLSLDPGQGLVYIKTRSVEIKGKWVKVLEVSDSANGKISVARQCGRLLDCKNPVVEKDARGKVIGVSVELLVPSIPSPRWDVRSFDESDFERWRRASHRERARSYKEGVGKKAPDEKTYNYANALYTSWLGGMDPEFARAKAISHGIKKLGTNQNESRATGIVIQNPTQIIIDPEMDRQANGDETENFTPAEVISTTTNQPTITNEFNMEDLG